MIRNAIIHMHNEQPLMADLRSLPTAADACLMCTNLRQIGGKKPLFTDALDSWFLIPLGVVRFVEVPQSSIAESEDDSFLALPAGPIPAAEPMDMDEGNDLLRRMREM